MVVVSGVFSLGKMSVGGGGGYSRGNGGSIETVESLNLLLLYFQKSNSNYFLSQ